MPTRPTSPDPSASAGEQSNPFAGLGAGMGVGLDFFQDWMKAAGSALPHLQGATGGGTPGMTAWTMPTLDPAELEKRIQDLKTVQFWLEQNARMIAMSIQGLEVQRMTLTTLKGMNVSMDALRESLKARHEAPTPAPEPAPPPTSSWAARREQAQAEAQAEAAAASDAAAQGEAPGSDTAGAEKAEGSELINPMRWWDTLTQQFTHLASQAAQTVGDSVGGSMDMLKQAQATAGGDKASGRATAKAAGKTASTGAAKTAKAKPTAGAAAGKAAGKTGRAKSTPN
jgi:hypothetical protein